MEAILTYSLIEAKLKKGMFVLVNGNLGVVKNITPEEIVVNYYKDDNVHINKYKGVVDKEDFEKLSKNVIKLIAIIDNNPVSINHKNYDKLFKPMLTYPKGVNKAYITEFIETKQWIKPIKGEIIELFASIPKEEKVEIIDLGLIDEYSIYEPYERIATVVERKANNKYIIMLSGATVSIEVDRSAIKRETDDKIKLFEVMVFDTLQSLVSKGEVKTVESKKKVKKDSSNTKTKTIRKNPFLMCTTSEWYASFDYLLEDSKIRQWCAVNRNTKEKLAISVPLENIPVHQFSTYGNDYWIPGTPRVQTKPEATLKNFAPFRENLSIFGSAVTKELGNQEFTFFVLDNRRQESLNKYIYLNRDLTEERRSEFTLKKLPVL